MNDEGVKLDAPTRILHLGLLVTGVWAWWIGEDAHDYHKPVHDGYVLHMYVGLSFVAFLALRLIWGFVGPRELRFSAWFPWTRERFEYVKADVRTLLRFKMPEPATHRGLNAFVQSLGIVLFTWQGTSGTLMSMMIVPGTKTEGWLSMVREVHHEWGGIWIPGYLGLHVGAVVLHAFTGKQIWKKMVFME